MILVEPSSQGFFLLCLTGFASSRNRVGLRRNLQHCFHFRVFSEHEKGTITCIYIVLIKNGVIHTHLHIREVIYFTFFGMHLLREQHKIKEELTYVPLMG